MALVFSGALPIGAKLLDWEEALPA